MASVQAQSRAPEASVRDAIASALTALEEHKPEIATNEEGRLVVDTGSVGMAYAAGALRKAEKMPMRISVTTTGGGGGTGLLVNVESRGTGGGISGGLIGMRKQKKGEAFWLGLVLDAIPDRVD